MENNSYIAAIDFGSSNITAAVASKDPDGRLNIIDLVTKPMKGMSVGEVTNIEAVTGAVRSAVDELENSLDIKITEAYAGISGHDIKCANSSYFVYVSGEGNEIRQADVDSLHASMSNLQPPEGIAILNRTPQKYVIDSHEETMQPVGCFGQQLEATFNFILAKRSSLERLNKTFLRLGIKQSHLFTNAQASAEAVLTDDERELGVAVVDIGADCTDICIWQDNIMRYVSMLPIGGSSINRDIRSIAIPERFIEKLKTTHGYAMVSSLPEEKRNQRIKIKGRTPRENKEIPFLNLAQIIEARMLDIIENVVEEIRESGYAEKLGSGIVLTGGGALLNDVATLFHEHTKFDVRVGGANAELLNDDSLAYADDPHLSAIIGLLLLGADESNLEATDTPLRRLNAETEQDSAEQQHETALRTSSAPQRPDQIRNVQQQQPVQQTKTQHQDEPKTELKDPEEEKITTHKEQEVQKRKKGFFSGVKKIFTDIFEVVDDDEI